MTCLLQLKTEREIMFATYKNWRLKTKNSVITANPPSSFLKRPKPRLQISLTNAFSESDCHILVKLEFSDGLK